MAKSSKKHGATKNAPLSPLEIALLHYEAGDVVAARAQAKALASQATEKTLAEPALALAAHTKPPLYAYAYALAGIAVAMFLGLVIFLRS